MEQGTLNMEGALPMPEEMDWAIFIKQCTQNLFQTTLLYMVQQMCKRALVPPPHPTPPQGNNSMALRPNTYQWED